MGRPRISIDIERARRLRDARDRLTDPEQVVDRELSVLHVPDPAALDLPEQATEGAEAQLLSAKVRLAGQLFVYALLEDLLLGGGDSSGVSQAEPSAAEENTQGAPRKQQELPL